MANLKAFLERLQEQYPDSQSRGKAFERVCKWFLAEDPFYGQEFTQIWLWDEWPGRWGPDIGIDLVAETKDGTLCAIQCKCQQDQVASDEIDSFIAASARPEFQSRLLISTSGITRASAIKLDNNDKPSPYLLADSLDQLSLNWMSYFDVIVLDPDLEIPIRYFLDNHQGILTPHDMEQLTELDLNEELPDYEWGDRDWDSPDINHIFGLEHAINLKYLDLVWYGEPKRFVVDNLRPLAGLTKLESLIAQLANPKTSLSSLSGLVDLRVLSLSKSEITDINALSTLVNLVVLDLENNSIEDVSPLSGMNLEYLTLSGNNFLSDIGPLGSCDRLESLFIDRCMIGNLSPLASYTNLKHLAISPNATTDLSPLGSLTKLESLLLSNGGDEDDYEWDEGESTSSLSLRDTEDFNDFHDAPFSDLGALPILKTLTHLTINYPIDDLSPLANFTNLTHLVIRDGSITDLRPLEGLTHLLNLDLSNNQITDLSPLASLTNLTSLYLDNNLISDLSPLSTLSKLERLYLNNNDLSEDPSMLLHTENDAKYGILESLKNRLKPTSTDSEENTYSLATLKPLESLTSLRILWIRNNGTLDIRPLFSLPNLELLQHYNTLLDAGPYPAKDLSRQLQERIDRRERQSR